MGQHLENGLLSPLFRQLGGQLDGVAPVFSNAAAEPGPGPAVEPDLGVDVTGDGYLDGPGLGDDQGHQPVDVLLCHGFHLYSLTGTGFVMAKLSGATAHSTASTFTPARAASPRAAPNSGWVRSLGEKAVMPSIWMTTHTAAS